MITWVSKKGLERSYVDALNAMDEENLSLMVTLILPRYAIFVVDLVQ